LNHFGSQQTKTFQSRKLCNPISPRRHRNQCYILEMRFRMSIRATRRPKWHVLKCAIRKKRHLAPSDPRNLRPRLQSHISMSGSLRRRFQPCSISEDESGLEMLDTPWLTCPWQHLGCPFTHKVKAQMTRHTTSCAYNPQPVLQKCDNCEAVAYTRINRLFEHYETCTHDHSQEN
jgi:hypothetical protein